MPMQTLLDQIAGLLRSRGLTIDYLTPPGFNQEQVWHVSDVAEEVIIRVRIEADINGHPEFWVSAFASYAAKYLVPIVTKIGDARDEVVQQSINARNRPS